MWIGSTWTYIRLKQKQRQKTRLLLFIDFKKAFDLVSSRILLRKLCYICFNLNSLKLIDNYFANRTQLVKINDTVWIPLDNNLGVPQGSGPKFFTIFINDLPFFFKKRKCMMLADDSTLYDNDTCLANLTQLFISKRNFWVLLPTFCHVTFMKYMC